MQIAISRPLAANRTVRAAVAVLAAAAATGVVAVTSNGSDSSAPPASISVGSGSGSGSGDLSVYDGATLRHHGVKVIASQQPAVQPTAQQVSAANAFHHRQ